VAPFDFAGPVIEALAETGRTTADHVAFAHPKIEKLIIQGMVVGTCPRGAFCHHNMNKLPLTLLFLLGCASVYAQTTSATTDSDQNFYARFCTQTNAIQSKQPNWPPPLVTTYTGLFQVVRFDALHQITPTSGQTWNIDNSKGVSIIPWNRTEIDVNLPPYLDHIAPSGSTKPAPTNGAGDMSFLGKFRVVSANDKSGAYVISIFALATIPTGSYKNGSTDASVTPSLAVGKGFGPLAIQTTAGTTLYMDRPATKTTGNPVTWNLAAQYKIAKYFWPELESNATFYKGGTNHGKSQEFLTPGLLIGKLKLHPDDAHSRAGLTFGGGMQIATSTFHSYNHELVLTARWIY
jgi:hypothetical protein